MNGKERQNLVVVESFGFCGEELAASEEALKRGDTAALVEDPSPEHG